MASRLQRATGEAVVRLSGRRAGTSLVRLRQQGCARVHFPMTSDGSMEVAFTNSAGGLTGGDHIDLALELNERAIAVATTQSAERYYRATDGMASQRVAITLAEGARLDWLPRETILFDRCRGRRQLRIDMAANASLLMVETLLFGREAMQETLSTIEFRDSWDIFVGEKLVHAERLRLEGTFGDILAGPATLAGARAIATILHIAPDAEHKLPLLRAVNPGQGSDLAASAWNGKLCARLMAGRERDLTVTVLDALRALRRQEPPRFWMF